jgi:hypothetical protein
MLRAWTWDSPSIDHHRHRRVVVVDTSSCTSAGGLAGVVVGSTT